MQVHFLGGASSVGASCLAIQIADQWIVVDAGVRVDRKADPLPDLAQLQDKDVRAVFVTHAHADHIGALPLLHQAFPTVPFYTSRATALLMEVMLADALVVMNKRAVEEMELPLYPQSLVAGMLNKVRPIPVGESFALPEMPGVTVSTSRAGHIAGAISFGFVANDGSLVVSGDISMTPQHTVLGAVSPPVKQPDLLILESTYGARLHPNRQAEETRLAQAVAEGIARGGHVLIPCFGLGRGQELLLILQQAQEKGQIPDFPIYVDGLVRRVCATYSLLPEALPPRLGRQIRRGYRPFAGPNVTFVRNERERRMLLTGAPACILSSSGMLSGGPSVWYARQLVSDPNASILITGYQDEESPGRRLLDVAERAKETLELDGAALSVRCSVAKYQLSAHADGGELAAYAASLTPRRVALVHGDSEARAALRTLLTKTEVLLPTEGTQLDVMHGASRRDASQNIAKQLPSLATLPTGIGQDRPFEAGQIEPLWRVVSRIPGLRIVTARELAAVWYGTATEENTETILDTLAQDYEQEFFVPQDALEEAFRVRGASEEHPDDFLNELVGSVILLQVSFGSAKPALCRSLEAGSSMRAQLPKGVWRDRMRFPQSSIVERIGPAPQAAQQSNRDAVTYLTDLVRSARRIRRDLSARRLASQCREGARYTLDELCVMVALPKPTLAERLAVAKLLYQHPRLFTQERSLFDGEGITLYGLAPDWREGLEEIEEEEYANQMGILRVIEKRLGTPPDLYRRSVDPETGDVTLAFHFPEVAEDRYGDAIADAAEEAGVSITIAPHAHQGMLARVARQCLPEGLRAQGTPSIYLEYRTVSLHYLGQASTKDIEDAQSRFTEATGWTLEMIGDTITQGQDEAEASQEGASLSQSQPVQSNEPMNQYEALALAREVLSRLPGYQKVGGEEATHTMLLRFHFPDVARERYVEQFAQLEAATGWRIRLHSAPHQQALVNLALRLLPQGLVSLGTPSLYLAKHVVGVRCEGSASAEAIQEAQQRYAEETGWRLELSTLSESWQRS